MKCIDATEAAAWMATSLPTTDPGFCRSVPGAIARPRSYENLPAGHVLFFAKAALRWVIEGAGVAERASEVLLWVREYGIWDSSEHLPLERALRARWPDAGTHETHPGLLADPADPRQHDDLVGYAYLAMNFGWGITLAGDRGGRVAHANHDGFLWALADDAADRAGAERWLND